MRLLLDTHVLLALVEDRRSAFGAAITGHLSDPENMLTLSAASLWEIGIKWRLGKLLVAVPVEELPALLAAMGVNILAIEATHALAAVDPEPSTRDPFDRMLLAQCQVEGLKLVTVDRALADHPLSATYSSAR